MQQIKPVNEEMQIDKEPGLAGSPGKIKLLHLPELDALRTFAVVLVLLSHFLPTLGLRLPFSWYGVDVFFSMSGFLITTILLNALYNLKGKHRLRIIKNFIIRRSFRLFPVYYLFIIFFWLLKNYFNIWIWKNEFTPYLFTYTPNWLFYKIGLENASCFSHLWSLGVEEQFYLLWPWLLLFTPAKFRKLLIAVIIFIALACSFIYRDNHVRLLPFANFHTLGMGALIACFYTENGSIIGWLKKYRIIIATITFLNLIIVLYFFEEKTQAGFLYRAISLCLCTGALVLVSVYGWKGILGMITRNKQVQYIGKISYGIYLYHLAIPVLIGLLLEKMNYHINPVLLFFVYFILTFLIAHLSYKFLETPFLKLKKRFEN